MVEELRRTFREGYFPTTRFNDAFADGSFLELKASLQAVAEEVSSFFSASSYRVTSNLGKGKIAACPWIGLHSLNENFEASPTRGIYISLLWKYDGTGLCLSLQKGSDESSVGEIHRVVRSVRERFGKGGFSEDIDLAAPKGLRRPRSYELANIAGRQYSVDQLDDLHRGLVEMESFYREIVAGHEHALEKARELECEEQDYQSPRSATCNPGRRWIRDPRLRNQAIALAGYRCEFDETHKTFEVGGHQFMEGHHLVPVEFQDRFNRTLDFVENIVSLCPVCHRRIHLATPRERIAIATELYERRRRAIESRLGITTELFQSYYDDV